MVRSNLSIAVFVVLRAAADRSRDVIMTHGALMFALALGTALVFGFGGQDVAGRILHDAYQNTDIRSSVATCRPARIGLGSGNHLRTRPSAPATTRTTVGPRRGRSRGVPRALSASVD
jgi:hypothetical protein